MFLNLLPELLLLQENLVHFIEVIQNRFIFKTKLRDILRVLGEHDIPGKAYK